MAIPQDPTGSTNREQLKSLIKAWEELRADIKAILDVPGSEVAQAGALAELRSQRADIVNKIQDFVGAHPGLYDNAVNMGFREDLLPKPSGGRTPDGAQGSTGSEPNDGGGNASGDGGGGGGGGSGDGGGGGGGGSGGGGVNPNRFLPGIQGKDFRVVSFKGKTYVVYNVKVGGKNINVSWRVTEENRKKWGLPQGRDLTKAQFKKLNFFGLADDILVHGEKKHPFRQWVERVTAQYGGTGVLKNKQVMSVLLMGYAEGWDQESIKGAIRQTDFWQKSTQYSRRWNFELTDKEKSTTISSIQLKMREKAQELFGDNWTKYVDEKKFDDVALRIASGRFGLEGNPDDAFQNWATRLGNKAEGIMGTPAQVAHDEAAQSVINSSANPEMMLAQITQQAQEWLGFNATPDGDLLGDWAKKLASGSKSQVDWEKFLTAQKQKLHPYLDPDQTWRDLASTYKQMAERLIGEPIGYEDKWLSSLGSKKADGTPTGQALSLDEFEDMVRQSTRFWNSETAYDEGSGLISLLESKFLGKAA